MQSFNVAEADVATSCLLNGFRTSNVPPSLAFLRSPLIQSGTSIDAAISVSKSLRGLGYNMMSEARILTEETLLENDIHDHARS